MMNANFFIDYKFFIEYICSESLPVYNSVTNSSIGLRL
jgi:hypothetical protein